MFWMVMGGKAGAPMRFLQNGGIAINAKQLWHITNPELAWAGIVDQNTRSVIHPANHSDLGFPMSFWSSFIRSQEDAVLILPKPTKFSSQTLGKVTQSWPDSAVSVGFVLVRARPATDRNTAGADLLGLQGFSFDLLLYSTSHGGLQLLVAGVVLLAGML